MKSSFRKPLRSHSGSLARPLIGLLAAALLGAGFAAQAQDACPFRGELDTAYCDANKDLVADPPSDAK